MISETLLLNYSIHIIISTCIQAGAAATVTATAVVNPSATVVYVL